MKLFLIFLSFLSIVGLASNELDDDDEFSIPSAHQENEEQIPIISKQKKADQEAAKAFAGDVGDVEDVVKEVKLPEVDVNKLPLLDWKTVKPSDFWFEAIMVLLLGVYLMAYNHGKAKNKSIARSWLKSHLDVWKDNFSLVGDDKGHKLTEDGPRNYIMYGSGRVHCKHVYATMHLAPRHDIFQWALEYFSGMNLQDRVTFNVTLNDQESDGIIFAIVPRTKAASLAKERWDIDNFCKPKDFLEFPRDDYALLTDCPEFALALWSLPSLKKALAGSIASEAGVAHKSLIIEKISLSDLPEKEPESLEQLSSNAKTLQFVFSIPELDDSKECKEYQALLSLLVMDVIDLIGKSGRLSSEASAKSKKLRNAAEAAIIRKTEEKRKQELAEKKYADKIAKEKSIVNLSPSAQRKAEEKMKRAEAKKLNSKRIKKI